MAFATRRAAGSSPYSRKIRASSASSSRASSVAAVSPCRSSMRMSSGPSFMNPNPRSGRSSCMLETPKSSKIPVTAPMPIPRATSAIPENSARTTTVRPPKRSRRFFASSTASPSRSSASSRAPSPAASKMASECPPAPAVPSMYHVPGATGPRGTKRSTVSRRRTGMCGAGDSTMASPRPLRRTRPGRAGCAARAGSGGCRRGRLPPPPRPLRTTGNAAGEHAGERKTCVSPPGR